MMDTLPPHPVVLVDDSEEMRRLISKALDRSGFAVTALPDGAAALEYLAGHTPAVILLDLMLPGMNGLQLLARIRNHPALTAVPVVIVTGTMTFERDLVDAGATALLRKPFELAALIALLRTLIATAQFEKSKGK